MNEIWYIKHALLVQLTYFFIAVFFFTFMKPILSFLSGYKLTRSIKKCINVLWFWIKETFDDLCE